MTPTQQKLEAYTQAFLALDEHKRANIAVFSAHENLVGKLIDAENDLRDEIEVSKEAPKNEHFEVKITPQSMTFADIEVIDQCIRDGVIPPAYRDKIVKTENRPSYVGIRRLAE